MGQTHGETVHALIMNECVARGMEPPFISVAVDAQGFGSIARNWLDTDRYWDGETLAGTPQLPGAGMVHMLVVDGADQCTYFTVEADDAGPRFRVIEGGTK